MTSSTSQPADGQLTAATLKNLTTWCQNRAGELSDYGRPTAASNAIWDVVEHLRTLQAPASTVLAAQQIEECAVADFARDLAQLIHFAYPAINELAVWLVAKADSLDAGGDDPGPVPAPAGEETRAAYRDVEDHLKQASVLDPGAAKRFGIELSNPGGSHA